MRVNESYCLMLEHPDRNLRLRMFDRPTSGPGWSFTSPWGLSVLLKCFKAILIWVWSWQHSSVCVQGEVEQGRRSRVSYRNIFYTPQKLYGPFLKFHSRSLVLATAVNEQLTETALRRSDTAWRSVTELTFIGRNSVFTPSHALLR